MKILHSFALALMALPLTALAIDLQPNDIVAPIPGKNHAMLSYLNTDNSTYYRNGSVLGSTRATRQFASPDIGTQSAILRLATSYTIQDLPAVSYLQLPYGTIKPAGSLAMYPADTGIGDLTIATAIWPYHNRATRTYLGLAGYLISPTGSYSSQRVFNSSENRFKTDVQLGFQTPITSSVDGMIAVDTMWFGGNSQCATACGLTSNGSLTQKPLTTTQLGPIYRINEIFTVGASYFYVAGGATSINNNYLNNVVNTQRFLLSALAYYPFGRISLQYGRDTEIKNSFIETRRLAIRYTTEF